MAVIIFSGSRRSYDSHLKDLKYVFSLQFPKLKWFSKPIYYHDSTVEVKNSLARVNISRTIYYEDGIIFENLLCLFASTIEMVATSSERPLPNSLSYFTQENWFWKWFWKTIGEVDLDFKWAISLGKLIFIIKIPTCNRFSKAPSASSMLILRRES